MNSGDKTNPKTQGSPFVSPLIISGGVFDSQFSSTELMEEVTNPMDELPFDPNEGGEWTGFKK